MNTGKHIFSKLLTITCLLPLPYANGSPKVIQPSEDRVKIQPPEEKITLDGKSYKAISFVERSTFSGVTANPKGEFPELEFTLSERTVGFSVYIDHLDEKGSLHIKKLVPAAGGGKGLITTEQIYQLQENPYQLNQYHLSHNPTIPSVFTTVTGVSFPSVPAATFKPGQWKLQIAQDDSDLLLNKVNVYVVSKVRSEPKQQDGKSVLNVNVHMGNVTGFPPVDALKAIQAQTGMDIFQTNLAKVKEVFAKARIDIRLNSLSSLPQELHEASDYDLIFYPPTPTPGILNLLLLHHRDDPQRGLAPLDGSTWSFLDAEGFGSVIAEGSLGNITPTIIHEMGHSLGLFHVEDDFLSDTCAAHHNFLKQDDNQSQGCGNIMLTNPDTKAGFSQEQIQMMLKRPIIFDYNPL